jgi:hypothetical protein
MAETSMRTVRIARQPFRLAPAQVVDAMNGVLPEPIASHYVVVGSRRYPPKQVIGELTGLDRADFTTHQARRVLMNLGFPVGRRRATSDPGPASTRSRPIVDSDVEAEPDLNQLLRQLPGQWVATKGNELLVAATTPHAVVSWLSRHDRKADSMFRVPEDEVAASGWAPL